MTKLTGSTYGRGFEVARTVQRVILPDVVTLLIGLMQQGMNKERHQHPDHILPTFIRLVRSWESPATVQRL